MCLSSINITGNRLGGVAKEKHLDDDVTLNRSWCTLENYTSALIPIALYLILYCILCIYVIYVNYESISLSYLCITLSVF